MSLKYEPTSEPLDMHRLLLPAPELDPAPATVHESDSHIELSSPMCWQVKATHLVAGKWRGMLYGPRYLYENSFNFKVLW